MTNGSRKWFYLGFGLYWTWVYLSFNSQQITSQTLNGVALIPLLHILSGLTGCIAFVVAICRFRRMTASPHRGTFLWMMAALTAFGSLFYALPLVQDPLMILLVGALIPGFASVWIVLGWGDVYSDLDVRDATKLTAGSFLVSGVLYLLIASIPQPFSGAIVIFLPVLSVFMLYLCDPSRFVQNDAATEPAKTSLAQELSSLFRETFSIKVILGIFMTMFVCGGLRVYSSQIEGTVYLEPLLVALPTAIVALAFLAYSMLLKRTSLNLGPLYRIAMPLLAIASVGLAVFGTDNAQTSFLVVSAGSALMDMLTWVLLIEIARSSHYPPLLVFAVGRCVIHLGMALGEMTALMLVGSMIPFFIAAVAVLVVVAGFLFTDRDMTYTVEPPTADELPEALEPAEDLDARIRMIAERCELSPRETEVFLLWATGHGSKAIQEKLVVSPSTVKTHLRHIYEKCDVHSRADILELIENAR